MCTVLFSAGILDLDSSRQGETYILYYGPDPQIAETLNLTKPARVMSRLRYDWSVNSDPPCPFREIVPPRQS